MMSEMMRRKYAVDGEVAAGSWKRSKDKIGKDRALPETAAAILSAASLSNCPVLSSNYWSTPILSFISYRVTC